VKASACWRRKAGRSIPWPGAIPRACPILTLY
jgi:hypothetical protein